MRPFRFAAAFAIALCMCAITEPARAAPDSAAAPQLVESLRADRGSPTMSFNINNSYAGDIVLERFADEVTKALRATQVDGEDELIREAANLAEIAIGPNTTADHVVEYSISGSIRETGVRALSVNVSSRRLRGVEEIEAPRTTAEPWTPRRGSLNARSRAERGASSTAVDARSASTGEESSAKSRTGTRAANSG